MLDGYQAVNQRGKHQIILIYNQIGEIQPQSSQATYSLKFERYKEDNGWKRGYAIAHVHISFS